jgi:hypothetical protein
MKIVEVLAGIILVFLFLAGFGRQLLLVKMFGVVVGLLSLLIVKMSKGKIKIPKYFKGYLLVLLILGISIFWSKNRVNSLEDWLMFIAGGEFWLVSFNLRERWRKYWDKLMVIMGLVFGGLYIYKAYLVKDLGIEAMSLFEHFSSYKNHLLLGDFWSVLIVIIMVWLLRNNTKIVNWGLLGFGGWLVFVSQSRTALLSIIVAVLYLINVKNNKQIKQWGKWVIGLALAVFLVFGLSKSTLLVRDYYLESLVGLKTYPTGVGLSNFKLISEDPAFHVLGRNDTSVDAHSIVFEMISGIGWLSLIFLFWFYLVVKEVVDKKDQEGLVYRVALIALTTNFLLFSSYLSPTMFWLWFICLGMV